MDSIGIFDILDIIIPCALIFYGFRWLTSPPEFGSSKGIGTKLARESEENWRMAHSFGGKLGIIFGVIMLALAVVKRFITDDDVFRSVTLISTVIGLGLILSLMPLVNLYLKKKSR